MKNLYSETKESLVEIYSSTSNIVKNTIQEVKGLFQSEDIGKEEKSG